MRIGDAVTIQGHDTIPDGTKAVVSKLEEFCELDGERHRKYREDVVQICYPFWRFFRKKEWVFKHNLKRQRPSHLRLVK